MVLRFHHKHIRDLSESIRETAGLDGANRFWESEEPKTRSPWMHSFRFNFREHARELRSKIIDFLNISVSQIPNARIVVPAGYGGHFSNFLHGLGFQVIHTDLVKNYAKAPKNMPTLHSAAHELPRIRKVSGYVSFEAHPIFQGYEGAVFIFKALLNTEHGLLDIGNNGPYKQDIYIDIKFRAFEAVYGISSESELIRNFIFHKISVGGANREILERDLKVLLELAKKRIDYSSESMARDLGLTEQDVAAALHNINSLIVIEKVEKLRHGYNL